VLFTKYYYGDRIKEGKMDGHERLIGEMRKLFILVVKPGG